MVRLVWKPHTHRFDTVTRGVFAAVQSCLSAECRLLSILGMWTLCSSSAGPRRTLCPGGGLPGARLLHLKKKKEGRIKRV